MSDRKLGYFIIVIIFLILCAGIGYGIHLFFFPRSERVIAFSQVGNICLEDPVSYHGITIGTIRRLDGVGDRIFATVEFFEPMTIYANYDIVTLDKGLMGDRIITVEPGDSSLPVVSADDTLHGTFIKGISEVLGMTWTLQGGVRKILLMAEQLQSGADYSPSLIEQFLSVSAALDSISRRLAAVASVADQELPQQLGGLNTMLSSARTMIRGLDKKSGPAITSIDEQVRELQDFVVQLDGMLQAADTTLQKIRTIDRVLGEQVSFDLSRQLREIRQLIKQIEDGRTRLKLRIRRLKE